MTALTTHDLRANRRNDLIENAAAEETASISDLETHERLYGLGPAGKKRLALLLHQQQDKMAAVYADNTALSRDLAAASKELDAAYATAIAALEAYLNAADIVRGLRPGWSALWCRAETAGLSVPTRIPTLTARTDYETRSLVQGARELGRLDW